MCLGQLQPDHVTDVTQQETGPWGIDIAHGTEVELFRYHGPVQHAHGTDDRQDLGARELAHGIAVEVTEGPMGPPYMSMGQVADRTMGSG
jgi:hypothetical protein